MCGRVPRLRLERSNKRWPELLHEALDGVPRPHQRLLLVHCSPVRRACACCSNTVLYDGRETLHEGRLAGGTEDLQFIGLEQLPQQLVVGVGVGGGGGVAFGFRRYLISWLQ